MAISAKGIGWSNESNLLWNIWRQLERLTGVAKFSSGPQGIQGPQGEQGVQGVQGTTGETGAALTVLGSYPNLAAFLAGAGGSPGNPGDAWILLNDGSLEVWNTATNLWDDAGDLLGPAGPQGAQGVQGEQGIQGQQGIQGVAGTNGTSGTSGSSGTSGAQGPAGLPGFFAQTADSTPVTATTVETTIIGTGVGTLTVPANGFSIGDSFQCSLDGIISCISSATLHIHVKTLDGTILADTGIITLAAATSKNWIMNLFFTVRTLGGAGTSSISSGGLFSYIRNGGTQFEGSVLSNINNTTFNTTINNTLVITAQWNSTNADNSITTRNFTLTKVY